MALLRRLVQPVMDIRDPVQIASDRLAARAVEQADYERLFDYAVNGPIVLAYPQPP